MGVLGAEGLRETVLGGQWGADPGGAGEGQFPGLVTLC